MGQPLEVHIRKLQDLFWSEVDPDGRGFVPLADALRRAGDLREAHRLLRDGLNRHPDFLSGHVVAAWLSMDRGDMEEAESRFRTVLDMDPGNVAALRGLAEVLLERGEPEAAMGCLETLQREDPVDPTLPDRIMGLRIQIEAGEGTPVEVDDLELPIWDNLEEVAEELDWEEASIQADAGRFGEPEGAPEEVEGPEGEGEPEEPVVPVVPEGGEEWEGPLEAGEPEEVEWTETASESHPTDQSHQPEVSQGDTEPALVVEDGEPIPAPDEIQEALVTPTLGEIYLRQGFFDRAEEVFEALLEGDPDNERLRQRLDETRSLMTGQGSQLEDEAEGLADEGIPEVDDLQEGEEPPPEASSRADRTWESGDEVVAIESLAPDRIGTPSPEEVPPQQEVPEGPISIEAPAPDEPVAVEDLAPEEPISIEALAPDEPVAVEDLAPEEPISIEALAPDEPVAVEDLAPEGPISIEALAPDEPVAVEDLAPEEPISIEALAPDEPVEESAPDGDLGPPDIEAGGDDETEEDSTLDEFERWLENL